MQRANAAAKQAADQLAAKDKVRVSVRQSVAHHSVSTVISSCWARRRALAL